MKRRGFLAAAVGAAIAPEVHAVSEYSFGPPRPNAFGLDVVFIDGKGIWLYQPPDVIRIGGKAVTQ